MRYTVEQVKEAARESVNFSELCRKVQCPDKGNSYQILKKRCSIWKIDTSHFSGKSHKGSRNPNYIRRKKSEDILHNNYIFRASCRELKRALIEQGVEYKCSECNLRDWLGKEISLDIDHINGDWSNNLKENLRFLCPNCHRQTDTFGSKNKRNVS